MKNHFHKYGIIYKNILAFIILRELLLGVVEFGLDIASRYEFLGITTINISQFLLVFIVTFLSMQVFRFINKRRVLETNITEKSDYSGFVWFMIKFMFGFNKTSLNLG